MLLPWKFADEFALLQVNDVVLEVGEGDARNVLCEAVEKHHASILVVGNHGYGAIKRYSILILDFWLDIHSLFSATQCRRWLIGFLLRIVVETYCHEPKPLFQLSCRLWLLIPNAELPLSFFQGCPGQRE